MHMRWRMLAVLFTARLSIAFQFQAVAALSGAYQDGYGVGLDSIGFLIGLYLSPGVALALPSGVIGAVLGGKRGVGLGLVLMVAGATLALVATTWSMELVARVLAGTGGVLLNVLMTKMVSDWFGRSEIATAMGIFVNSWPVGIGIALVSLPALHAQFGMVGTDSVVLAVCLSALSLFMWFYRDPPGLVQGAAGPILGRPGGWAPVLGAVLAGLIWGLMNAALVVAFSFGPLLLVSFGQDPGGAPAWTSLILWALAVATPLGGLVADRTGRHDLVIAVTVLGFAVAMAGATTGQALVVLFLLIGVGTGLSAGPIMGLPSSVLPAHWRAQGMGVFFTTYYVILMLAPPLAGALAERTGSVTAAFWFGAVLAALCLPCLAALRPVRAALSGAHSHR